MTSNSPEQKIEEEIAKLKDQWIHWVEKFSIDTLHQRDERIRSEVKVVLNEIEASDLGKCQMFKKYLVFIMPRLPCPKRTKF